MLFILLVEELNMMSDIRFFWQWGYGQFAQFLWDVNLFLVVQGSSSQQIPINYSYHYI